MIMKKSYKPYLWFVLLLVVIGLTIKTGGCKRDEAGVLHLLDNPKEKEDPFKRQLLFITNDCCKVYRFFDQGYYHYFVECPGTVEGSHSNGRATDHELIQTVTNTSK